MLFISETFTWVVAIWFFPPMWVDVEHCQVEVKKEVIFISVMYCFIVDSGTLEANMKGIEMTRNDFHILKMSDRGRNVSFVLRLCHLLRRFLKSWSWMEEDWEISQRSKDSRGGLMLSNKLSILVCQSTPVGAQILLIDTLSTMRT